MTGAAQILNRNIQIVRLITAVAVCMILLLLPEMAYAENIVAARSGFARITPWLLSLPILAAVCAYYIALSQRKTNLQQQRYIFLFFTCVPALLFYLYMTFDALEFRTRHPLNIADELFSWSIVSIIWFSASYLIYGAYAYMTDLPRPRLLRWATRKRILLLCGTLFFLKAAYTFYPQIYFNYHTARANMGSLESQLWLGKTYEAPRTKRFFGGRANYTERNYSKAHDWYVKAAEQGSTDAYIELAELYSGLEKEFEKKGFESQDWAPNINIEKAEYWAQKAANTRRGADTLAQIKQMSAADLPLSHKTKTTRDPFHNTYLSARNYTRLSSVIGGLLAITLLNVWLFVSLFRIVRRTRSKTKTQYKWFIALAATWPTAIVTPFVLIAVIFSHSFNLAATSIATNVLTVCFSVVTYSFIKQAQKASPDDPEKYAFRYAKIYGLIGLFCIAFPHAMAALFKWVYFP